LSGCGWPPEKIEAIIRDDAEVLALWREAVTAPKHVHRDNDNVIIKGQQGNSKSYTLDRLKRKKPDLFKKVVAGELSANAAAIKVLKKKASVSDAGADRQIKDRLARRSLTNRVVV
jgi:hypothetical protein